MAPVYGWKGSQPQDGSKTVYVSSQGDKIAEDINTRLKKNFMLTLCRRPNEGVTEVNDDFRNKVIVFHLPYFLWL